MPLLNQTISKLATLLGGHGSLYCCLIRRASNNIMSLRPSRTCIELGQTVGRKPWRDCARRLNTWNRGNLRGQSKFRKPLKYWWCANSRGPSHLQEATTLGAWARAWPNPASGSHHHQFFILRSFTSKSISESVHGVSILCIYDSASA